MHGRQNIYKKKILAEGSRVLHAIWEKFML